MLRRDFLLRTLSAVAALLGLSRVPGGAASPALADIYRLRAGRWEKVRMFDLRADDVFAYRGCRGWGYFLAARDPWLNKDLGLWEIHAAVRDAAPELPPLPVECPRE